MIIDRASGPVHRRETSGVFEPPRRQGGTMVLSPSPNAQSSAPTFSLATLRTVLGKGQAAHPHLACRMDRAAHIVAFRSIEPATSGAPGAYWVQSESSDREYWV